MSYVTNYKIVKPFYEKLDISFILKTIIALKIAFSLELESNNFGKYVLITRTNVS